MHVAMITVGSLAVLFSFFVHYSLGWMMAWIGIGMYFLALKRMKPTEAFRASLLFGTVVNAPLLWHIRDLGIDTYWFWVIFLSSLYAFYGALYAFVDRFSYAFLYRTVGWLILSFFFLWMAPFYSLLITQSSNGLMLWLAQYIGFLGISFVLFVVGHGIAYFIKAIIDFKQKVEIESSSFVLGLGVSLVIISLIAYVLNPALNFGETIYIQLIPGTGVRSLELKNEYYRQVLSEVYFDAQYIVLPFDDFEWEHSNLLDPSYRYVSLKGIIAAPETISNTVPLIELLGFTGLRAWSYGDIKASKWYVWYVEKGNLDLMKKYAQIVSSVYGRSVVVMPQGENGFVIQGREVLKPKFEANNVFEIGLSYGIVP